MIGIIYRREILDYPNPFLFLAEGGDLGQPSGYYLMSKGCYYASAPCLNIVLALLAFAAFLKADVR
jgi:hypothetical protein